MRETKSTISTWPTIQLGALFKLSSGSTKPDDLAEEQCAKRPYPVYGGNGVMGYSAKANVDGVNIVIGRVGANCGCVHLADDKSWITDNALYTARKLVAYDDAFVSELLRYLRLDRLRGQSGQPLVTQEPIHSLKTPLPPLPEQRKIAEILRTWDEAIEKLEALRVKKESAKRNSLTKILDNEDWPLVPISDLGRISSAGVDKKVVEGQQSVRLLNFMDVLGRDFLLDSEISHQVTAPERKVKQCDVRQGDVFFTPSSETRDDIAHSAVAMEDMLGVTYSYHIVRLRFSKDIDLRFRAYLFKSNHFLRQAFRLCAGSGQRYVLSQNQFREMTVRLPNLEKQQKIGTYFWEGDKEIALIGNKIALLKDQKRGLMQKLLTGEWRVTPAPEHLQPAAEKETTNA